MTDTTIVWLENKEGLKAMEKTFIVEVPDTFGVVEDTEDLAYGECLMRLIDDHVGNSPYTNEWNLYVTTDGFDCDGEPWKVWQTPEGPKTARGWYY